MIDITELTKCGTVKIEVSAGDLIAFGQSIVNETLKRVNVSVSGVRETERENTVLTGRKAAIDFLNGRGYKFGKSTLDKFISNGLIPYSKIGHYNVFDANELIEWANRQIKRVDVNTAAAVAVSDAAKRKLNKRRVG
jgi:hypothetical protein